MEQCKYVNSTYQLTINYPLLVPNMEIKIAIQWNKNIGKDKLDWSSKHITKVTNLQSNHINKYSEKTSLNAILQHSN